MLRSDDRARNGPPASAGRSTAPPLAAPQVRGPDACLIIGTGFARFGEEIEDAVRIPFSDLPLFPPPGVPGHVGELVLGRLEGRTLLCFRGKIALLDGHPAQLVALPVRLAA